MNEKKAVIQIDIAPRLLIGTSCYLMDTGIRVVEVYVNDSRLLEEPVARLYDGRKRLLLREVEIRDARIVLDMSDSLCMYYLLEFYNGRIIRLFRES